MLNLYGICLNKMKIDIYTKTTCPYSTMAKQVLELNGYEFKETVLDDDDKRTQFYESCGDYDALDAALDTTARRSDAGLFEIKKRKEAARALTR